jgi:uncharacterized protein YjbI with pentapeptide repeats
MTEPEDTQTAQDVYEQLEKATPEEKREIVLRLIKAHPAKRLELPARDGKGANLARADLHKLDLRCADLQGAHLEAADLQSVNLGDANLLGANLHDANLREANLQGAELFMANLQDAYLWFANLRGADLWFANLRGADLWFAELQGANLGGARLEGVDLSHADITHIKIAGAWLDHTRLQRKQLGGAIGEEVARSHGDARQGYLGLKQNFDDLGDYDAASWAYRRERCMEKWEAWYDAWEAFFTLKWRPAVKGYAKVAGDWVVQLVCDYGENGWLVLGWMAALLLVIGPLLVLVAGGLEWPSEARTYIDTLPPLDRAMYEAKRYLLYMLGCFTTMNYSGLQPANKWVSLVSNLITLAGIFLTGLLGFVAGNRIRRA